MQVEFLVHGISAIEIYDRDEALVGGCVAHQQQVCNLHMIIITTQWQSLPLPQSTTCAPVATRQIVWIDRHRYLLHGKTLSYHS